MWPVGNSGHMNETAVLMRKKIYSSFSLLKLPYDCITWIPTRIVAIIFKMMRHQMEVKT